MEGVESPETQNRSFWAVELTPGKEYTTTPEFDLHVTQAVLPASAQDKGRSVITVKVDEEGADQRAFAIASLKLESSDSQSLDLVFDSQESITFTVSGKNPVHLSGYHIPPSGSEGDEFDYDSDELGSEDEDEEISGDEGSEGDEDEIDEEELKAQIDAATAKRKQQQSQNGAPAPKKAKQEQQAAPKQQTPKQEQKPQGQTPKAQGNTPKQQQPQQKSPAQPQKEQTKKLANGLEITTLKEGSGREAKNGDRVFVKYLGKLTKNGKVFDKSLDRPFSFGLGRREVIRGWDLGVAGMKIGEKRRLVIPSDLAYGAEGAKPEIPGNASLTFEVELVQLK